MSLELDNLADAWADYVARMAALPLPRAVWVENTDGSGLLVFPGGTEADLKQAPSLNTWATLCSLPISSFIGLLKAATENDGPIHPNAEKHLRELLQSNGLDCPEPPRWWEAAPAIEPLRLSPEVSCLS